MAVEIIRYVLEFEGGGMTGGVSALTGIGASLSGGKGPFGALTKVVDTLVAGIQTAINSLAEYNGALYGATVDFEYFMLGLKMSLADALGPTLAKYMQVFKQALLIVADLLKGLEPVLSFLADVLVRVIEIFKILQQVVRTLAGVFIWASAEIIDAIPFSFLAFDQKEIDEAKAIGKIMIQDAWKDFKDSWKVLTQGIAALGKDKEKEGQGLAMALYNFLKAFSQTKGAHGPMPGTTGALRWDAFSPNGSGPAERFILPKDRGEGVLPRPNQAAMHLHIADSVQVTAQDEERLHSELLQLRDMVTGVVRDMMDSRWLRIALARNKIMQGF